MARDGVPVGPEVAALVARAVSGERFDVSAECARVGVSTKTFYKYRKRFEAEGVEGFYPRSRRPLTSPTRVSAAVEDVVVEARKDLDGEGWDAGAEQIAFWIADHSGRWPAGELVPSRATINRVLQRRGQVVSVPQRRPRSARHRFEADQPNHMWQMDGFDYTLAGGRVACVLQIIDDCSRFDLALRAARSENAADVWTAVLWASSRYGLPARFLTDNGTAFSGARRGWTAALEENLRALGVAPCTSSIAHPQTCGKNERAHATVLKWLRKRPPASSLDELQVLLECYREHYNHRRRKTHLQGMTPAERYDLGPKDGPGTEPQPWPVEIRTATVSTSGCIGIDQHLLAIGRRHAATTVTVVRQHRHIAVFATNQLVAEFTLNGRRRYQAKNAVVSPMS
ncbi:MAG: DDE-type integrase/transposase/recombinase [Actinobacteria bacterium]|nr:DDE-type integrase/transposase/recombinase [Actinomycetota bacterium]